MGRQLFIFATDADELRVQFLRDLEHGVRTLAAKHHQANRLPRVEAELAPLGVAIELERLVKARIQNHARGAKNVSIVVPQLMGLLYGALRAADEVLRLALDPEVRRIIGDVGQDGDQRNLRNRFPHAFADRAIQVGHERDDQIREALAP